MRARFWNMPVSLTILSALNYLDIITTKYAIESGAGIEGNPLSRMLLNAGLLVEVKLFMSVLLFCLALAVIRVEDKIYGLIYDNAKAGLVWHFTNALIWSTVLFYVGVVLNNLFVLVNF